MTLFNLMGLVSTVALALPIIILLTTKLTWYRSFPALFFYYLFVLSFNLVLLGYIRIDGNFKFYLGVTCNLLDTPLILIFLLYFSKTLPFRKKLVIAIFSFVVFEMILVAIYGFYKLLIKIIFVPSFVINFA